MAEPQKMGTWWSLIAYPDSLPENWLSILTSEELLCKCLVSPLHDPDPEHLKPHYHVILNFDKNKTYKQIKELYSDRLNATYPTLVMSAYSMVRYCFHLDNPDKEQFIDPSIPVMQSVYSTATYVGGGLDIEQYFLFSRDYQESLHKRIMQEIDGGICFLDLCKWACRKGWDYFNEIKKYAYFYRCLTGDDDT